MVANSRPLLRLSVLCALACAALAPRSSAQDEAPATYVVLAAFAAGDPFDGAVRVLAEHHQARVLRFRPDALAAVKQKLRTWQPRHVALVMRPEQIEFGFGRRFLQLATELDDDPFVDCAYGYITGATAEDATAFAKRCVAAQTRPVRKFGYVAGGANRSDARRQDFGLRTGKVPGIGVFSAGEDEFPETGRDVEFLKKALPKVEGVDVIEFVGHGWPREVAGGPTFAEIAGRNFESAVAVNVACYTGVTNVFYRDDWRQGVMRREEVPLEESFCLALLNTGVVGYTAYLCPRPAGPELATDLARLLAQGASLGEARRRDYDKTVLGFLGYGEGRLQLESPEDGRKLVRGDAVRTMMLEGATGGVVFGDPALVPFTPRDEESPVTVEVETKGKDLRVRFQAPRRLMFLHCSDQTSKWGRSMALKVYERVPLGDALVSDVVVDHLKVGADTLPSRLVWATEVDAGQRYLQLKVNFPREQARKGDLDLRVRIVTTSDADAAKDRGGYVHPEPQSAIAMARRDAKTLVAWPALKKIAARRKVGDEALKIALAAHARKLGAKVEGDPVGRLAEFGAEGFQAMLCLLEAGHTHIYTESLLAATYRPGDERYLLELASTEELPGYAEWTVLRALAIADTPAVRSYLFERLKTERDPGEFMSTAQAMADLGDRRAIDWVGKQLLANENGWGGVAGYLVDALIDLGGEKAVGYLERVAAGGVAGGKNAQRYLRRRKGTGR